MRKLSSLILAGALTLGGCTELKQLAGQTVVADAGTIAASMLTPAELSTLQQLCFAAGPALGAATAPSMPSPVSGTATYAATYCAQLAAAPAGQVPSTTTSTTPSWLPSVITAVQTAAQVAGIVLPFIGLRRMQP